MYMNLKIHNNRVITGVIALIPIFPSEVPNLEWTKDEDHLACEEVRI